MHGAIFLWGFTGILGRLITLNELPLVWWRMLITVVFLAAFVRWRGPIILPSWRELGHIAVVGTLIALHWVTFYGSIKASNASIALSCLASAALFTAVFAPFFTRDRIKKTEVALGVFTIFGIALIFQFQKMYALGIVLGLVSAALSALFTVRNKSLLTRHEPGPLLLFELITGFGVLTLLAPVLLLFYGEVSLAPTPADLGWLVVLSVGCTVIPMQMSYRALQTVSPFLMNLSVNLEPIYTMVMAAIIFHEHNDLKFGFYLGAGVIILSVAVNALINSPKMSRWMRKK